MVNLLMSYRPIILEDIVVGGIGGLDELLESRLSQGARCEWQRC